MSISSEKPSSERPAEIGPPPYYHRSDCNICRKQDGLKTGSELLDGPRPGGYVVAGEHFLAEHAPLQESSAGTVIVEARRHLLDFGEMTPAELAEIGSILHRLVPAIKAATGVQRVYFLAVMERAPHFHLWLVPKKNEGELRGVAYLAQQPPLRPRTARQKRCRTRSESSSSSPDGGLRQIPDHADGFRRAVAVEGLSLRRPFLKDAQFGQPVVVFLKPLLFLAESREDQAGLHHVFRRILP